MIDRDEDGLSAGVANRLTKHNNLWLLPRFCIDNYLIVPEDLWSAFPPKQQAKVAGGINELAVAITAELERWVAHGVLWWTVNPLWKGLRSLGFKKNLLDPEIALDEQKIKETLAEWHNYLEPDKLWEQFQQKLQEVTSFSQEEKLKRWIHGKKFYEQVIDPLLNRLLGQKSAKDRKKSIFRHSPLPDDFSELFDKMQQ